MARTNVPRVKFPQPPEGAVATILEQALKGARILPLPDETGLGLLHFAVDPSISVAGVSQKLRLSGADASATPFDLAMLSDLVGVDLAARWEVVFPERTGYPAGGASGPPATLEPGDPGTLLPVFLGENAAPTGVSGKLIEGLTARFLPLPRLTSGAETWHSTLKVTLSASVHGPRVGVADSQQASVVPSITGSVTRAAAEESTLDATLRQTTGIPIDGKVVTPAGEIGTIAGSMASLNVASTLLEQTPPRSVTIEVPLALPTLVVPPLLLLCTGRGFQLPALAVCPVPGLASLDGLLAHLGSVVNQVDLIRRVLSERGLRLPTLYAEVVDAVGFLLRFLAGPVRFLPSPAEADLNVFELLLGVINDIEAQNEIRSLIYFGLPGPSVEIFRDKGFGGDTLEVGVTGAMQREGHFLVLLDDLQVKDEQIPGVLRPENMGGAIRWNRGSSYRFRGLEESTGYTGAVGGRALTSFQASRDRHMPEIQQVLQRQVERMRQSLASPARVDRDSAAETTRERGRR